MIETPQPIPADQMVAFPGPIETMVGPLRMALVISLQRMPRQKCSSCGLRRIGFRVGLGDSLAGPILCAKCAGIR